jgi:prepilin-type N-terminal cleavage/methylation domain-containing protein
MTHNYGPPRSSSESGYSLAEMLTVVALIGIISLVSIPNFMTLYRQSKMKASLRQFTTDVRALRARAASRNRPQKISFVATDLTTRSYQIFECNDAENDGCEDDDWSTTNLPNPKTCDEDPNVQCLDDTVYFSSTTFEDSDQDDDDVPDMIFISNGTVNPYPDDGGEIVLRTVSQLAVNQYTIEVSASGRVKVTEGNF